MNSQGIGKSTSDASGSVANTSLRHLRLNESIPIIETASKLVQQARQGIEAVLNPTSAGGKWYRQLPGGNGSTPLESKEKDVDAAAAAAASAGGAVARRCVALASALASARSAIELVSVLSTALDYKPLVRQAGAQLLSLYAQLADASRGDPMWLRVSTLCGPSIDPGSVSAEVASLQSLQHSVYGSYRSFMHQLLESLVDIALLSTRAYPSIVAALVTRFEQPPGADPQRLGVAVRDIPSALARLAAGLRAVSTKRSALRIDLQRRLLRLAAKVASQSLDASLPACVEALRVATGPAPAAVAVAAGGDIGYVLGAAAAMAGREIFSHASQHDVPLQAHMLARLLPALSHASAPALDSCLADGMERPASHEEDIAAFRPVWCLLALYGMATPAVWSDSCHSALHTFAAHSPPLSLPGDAAYLIPRISAVGDPLLKAQAAAERSMKVLVGAMEKSSLTPEQAVAAAITTKSPQGGSTSRSVARLRSTLQQALPGSHEAIAALAPPVLLYTAGVMHLEALRSLHSGGAVIAFSYLSSPALELSRASRYRLQAAWLAEALGTVGAPRGPLVSETAPGATLLGPPLEEVDAIDALMGSGYHGHRNRSEFVRLAMERELRRCQSDNFQTSNAHEAD
jgi:hypothetical protein